MANRNYSDFRLQIADLQSTSEISTRIAFESVEKKAEIATEIAVILIAAVSNPVAR